MFRELREETGLLPEHVRLLGSTRDWLRYRLPGNLVRKRAFPVCIGQKQKWFLLRMIAEDQSVHLNATLHPEFDAWRWVDFWHPLREVVAFKREVYRRAMQELAPLVAAHEPAPLPPLDAHSMARLGEA